MPVSPTYATLRENLFAIGWAKQSAWDSAAAATSWWRFLDGTSANPQTNVMTDREGDTSPYKSFAMKTGELGKIVIVERARPITMGCAFQALMGASSDTYVAATYNSTLAASCSAGATTVKLTADPGNVGTLAVVIDPTGTTPEVVTLDLTTRTTPNYTVTIASSGTLQYNHNNSLVVQSKAQHTMKRGLTVYEPYTIEVQYGTSGTAPYRAEQYVNAVCTEIQLRHQKGQPLVLQHTWYSSKVQGKASFSSVSYEGNGIPGTFGAPYVWEQAQNAWTMNGSSINGLMEAFNLSIKNSTDPNDLITDGLNPVYFTPELFDVDGQAQYLFTSWDNYYKTYFGNTTAPATTAADSYLIGTGSIQGIWTADGVNTLTVGLTNMAYTAAMKADPKVSSAKAMRQMVSFSALRTPAYTDPFSVVLTNTQNSAY